MPTSEYNDKVAEHFHLDNGDIGEKGFWSVFTNEVNKQKFGDVRYTCPELEEKWKQYSLNQSGTWPGDAWPELQKRTSRHEMQKHSMVSHQGEEAWSIVDHYGLEICSSVCCVVGFFVGYGTYLEAHINQSRADCIMTGGMDWNLVPPISRPCDFVAKLDRWEARRQAASASSTDPAANPAQPVPSSPSSPPTSPTSPQTYVYDEEADYDFEDHHY